MTREERISALSNLGYVKGWKDKAGLADKTIDICIEALKQELILDKVRAEIADLADADAYGDYQQGFSDGLMRATQTIDKYKAESEE